MVSNAKIRGDWVKKNKIFLLIVSGVILAGLLVYLNRGILLDHFWSKVESQLDYERSLEEGDDFNKISWGDLSFQINHHKSGNNLEYVSVADKESYILLKNISSYKIVEEKLYVMVMIIMKPTIILMLWMKCSIVLKYHCVPITLKRKYQI